MKISLMNITARGMRNHNLRVEYSPANSAKAPMGAKFGICGSKRSMTLTAAIITIKTKINLSLLLFICKFPFNYISGIYYIRRGADHGINFLFHQLQSQSLLSSRRQNLFRKTLAIRFVRFVLALE